MDKYVVELEKAQKEASFIPKEYRSRVVGFIFLGAVQGNNGNKYYYKDPSTGKYYSESEFDRHMRILIRNNQLKRYAKK